MKRIVINYRGSTLIICPKLDGMYPSLTIWNDWIDISFAQNDQVITWQCFKFLSSEEYNIEKRDVAIIDYSKLDKVGRYNFFCSL